MKKTRTVYAKNIDAQLVLCVLFFMQMCIRYAKCLLFVDRLKGSYHNLNGGSSSEAMEDFTGGVTEMFDLTQNPPSNLFKIISKAIKRESMMGCSIDVR